MSALRIVCDKCKFWSPIDEVPQKEGALIPICKVCQLAFPKYRAVPYNLRGQRQSSRKGHKTQN